MEAATSTTTRVLVPPKGWAFPNLRELWEHRDLVYFLVRRDVVIRYKQALIGPLWAVIQPLALAAVFTVFLGLVAKVDPPEGIPYPVYAVTGMVMWLAFSQMLERTSRSTIDSENLISKIYFPRIAIPVAAALPPIVDFAVGFVVVVALDLAYGFAPTVKIFAAPAALLLALMTALGFGLWLSALNVKYRDIQLAVPTILLIGLFITQIAYPLDQVPAQLQPIYALNPMVGVIELFRWSLIPNDWPGLLLVIPVITGIVTLVTGALYYERAQRNFADFI
jgi:lipopolysaccharide transport system permease protein